MYSAMHSVPPPHCGGVWMYSAMHSVPPPHCGGSGCTLLCTLFLLPIVVGLDVLLCSPSPLWWGLDVLCYALCTYLHLHHGAADSIVRGRSLVVTVALTTLLGRLGVEPWQPVPWLAISGWGTNMRADRRCVDLLRSYLISATLLCRPSFLCLEGDVWSSIPLNGLH